MNGLKPISPLRAQNEHPLRGEIALCLSGGGYRAAAFHLGTLEMLDELGLRDRIKVVSALSGGAIFSACYAIALCEGTDFETFARGFKEKLATTNPLTDAFDALPTSGTNTQPPSLIRSLADAYADQDFIGQMRFAELMRSDEVPADLIFGTTEFRSGKAFRFQMSRRSKPNIGNRPPLDIADVVAEDMRLADIVAASSCFPAAFEPMLFPNDFSWTEPLVQVQQKLTPALQDGVPLMDGGIYDNQGVDGALAVYRRKGMEVGLLLVCDTSARDDDCYQPPTNQQRGGPKLSTLRQIGQGFFFSSLLSAIALVAKAFFEVRQEDFALLDTILFGLPVLVCLAMAFTLRRIDQRITIEQARIHQQTSVALWPNLSQLRLLDFVDLLNARLLSLISLTNNIFMKRVRSLIQTSLRIGDKYRDRVISNQIYDLDLNRKTLFEENPWLKPTEQVATMAREAETVPSAVWFDNRQQLDNVIACGRATTCFSLLSFLLQKEQEALQDPTTPEAQLFAQAKSQWEQLNR